MGDNEITYLHPAPELPVTTPNPLGHKFHHYDVLTDSAHNVGAALSAGSHRQLQCQTRWSIVSDVGDDKTTSVACQADEVLTGCSSVKEVRMFDCDIID